MLLFCVGVGVIKFCPREKNNGLALRYVMNWGHFTYHTAMDCYASKTWALHRTWMVDIPSEVVMDN